jgi:hypothetical protein
VNPVVDIVYGYTNVEQLTIARDIVVKATATSGTPIIHVGSEVSGYPRDLNFRGTDFTYAGDQIDSMAQRSSGFEWTIEPRNAGQLGHVDLWLVLYYPQRGSSTPSIVLRKTPDGGNMSVESAIENTAADRRSRVWATGTGQPPSQVMAYDEDPGVADGLSLLRETMTNYSTVSSTSRLADHAQQERQSRAVPTNFMSVRVYFPSGGTTGIDPEKYGVGDRVRLIYTDAFFDMDLPAARITERSLHFFGSAADSAVLTVDLADVQLPDVSD